MKKLIAMAIALLSPAFAQAVTLTWSCSPSTVKPGANLTCSLVQSGGSAATTGPAAYLFTFSTSQVLGIPTIAAAGTASTAGLFAQANGNTIILDWLNTTVVPNALAAGTGVADGVVATIVLPIPITASCPGNSPCLTVTSSANSLSNSTGTALPVIVNPSAAVLISNGSCDTNGDGLVNTADATAEQTMVLAKQTGVACDRNGDGACNAQDVQIVIKAALGGMCTATQ